MVLEEVDELGAGEALVAFGDLRRTRDRAARDIFVLAAHFADLYNVDATRTRDADLRTLPGTERGIKLAGDGAPLVLEFAIAEMAAELAMTTWSARRLIGDALETRHRLPRIWARVLAGQVPTWIAAKVAQATRPLTPAQAATVDADLVTYADGRLPWTRFAELLAAKIIEADPDAAAAREAAAAEERFAKVGQSNDHGQRTLYVKTSAAEMARIDATIAYLADALKTLGDTDNEDRRRTKAVLILANPTQALTLLQALHTSHTKNRPGTSPEPRGGAGGESSGGSCGSSWAEDDTPLPDNHHPGTWPQDNDSDPGGTAADHSRGGSGPPPTPEPPGPPSNKPSDMPAGSPPAGAPPGVSSGSPPGSPPGSPVGVEAFTRPFHPDQVPACPCRGGTFTYDTHSLLPQVVLYLHLHADTLTRGNGVARWEDHGPITARYVRDYLGPHARFTVKPVIDPTQLAPVDGYETPERHREALHLRTPADVFPYAPNTSRRKQADHTVAYQPPHRGGAPGQTGLANLGPMTSYHHRVKTHAGWLLRQPFPGIYLWQTPHGAIYLVDHTGTRQLRRPHPTSRTHATAPTTPPEAQPAPPPRTRHPSALETHFETLIHTAA